MGLWGLLSRAFAALFLIVAFIAPIRADGALPSVAGWWYGEGYQAALKLNMVWVIERRNDGTFTVDFRS